MFWILRERSDLIGGGSRRRPRPDTWVRTCSMVATNDVYCWNLLAGVRGLRLASVRVSTAGFFPLFLRFWSGLLGRLLSDLLLAGRSGSWISSPRPLTYSSASACLQAIPLKCAKKVGRSYASVQTWRGSLMPSLRACTRVSPTRASLCRWSGRSASSSVKVIAGLSWRHIFEICSATLMYSPRASCLASRA